MYQAGGKLQPVHSRPTLSPAHTQGKMKFSSSFTAFILLSCLSASTSALEAGSGGWQLTQHLGNLSPYFKPPVPSGIQETLPGECKVDQVMAVRVLLP